jgi:GNAT superfamily N-acetyltransferase
VSALELGPLREEHVAAAAALLATRHRAHLAREPLLDARFTDLDAATEQVKALWAREGASGSVAHRAGRMVGYLLGAPRPGTVWGPNVWVEAASHAVVEPELARDLYALAAQRWVDEGRTAHYVVVPAHDAALVDAWFRLGFGQQHAHGLREVPEQPLPARGVRIRRAVPTDISALAALEVALPAHQGGSPVFSSGGIPTLDEAAAELRESFDDERFATFVAEVDGTVVGSAVGCALELSNGHTPLMRPPRAGFLGFAAVLPEARGRGVGRALGEAVIGWVTEAGFTSVATDWRVTNLLSSRTWPRLGFRPSFLRLHRTIGH